MKARWGLWRKGERRPTNLQPCDLPSRRCCWSRPVGSSALCASIAPAVLTPDRRLLRQSPLAEPWLGLESLLP